MASQPPAPGTLTVAVGDTPRQIVIESVVIAGFTGSDQAAVRAHLAELAELGVPIPESTPCYYQAPPSALFQGDRITVVEANTSGEAECVLIAAGDDYLITLGSDHTDRAAEAIDIPLSKVVTPKPIAATAWQLSDVADHLDQIELRSWIADRDDRSDEVLYQEGSLAAFIPAAELLDAAPFVSRPDTAVLFGGTLAAIGGIRPAAHFRAELVDPVAGRRIELSYTTVVTDHFH